MDRTPDPPTPLALLGFTSFERATFESYFRLARKHGPSYAIEPDPRRAQAIVADSDDRELCRRLAAEGLLGRTLALGTAPCAGAAVQLPRPFNLGRIARALDALPRMPAPAGATTHDARPSAALPAVRSVAPSAATVAPAATGHAAPPPAVASVHVERVLNELALRTTAIPGNLDVRALAAAGAPKSGSAAARTDAPGGHGTPRPDAPGRRGRASGRRSGLDHLLIVDDGDAALRVIAGALERHGFQPRRVRSLGEAHAALRRRHHAAVFVDAGLLGPPGLIGFEAAVRAAAPAGCSPTLVVLLAEKAAASAVRRAADPVPVLGMPVDEGELRELIGTRLLQRGEFTGTAADTTLT